MVISGPAPQYGIAADAIGNALASLPEMVRQLAMTLSGPPTRKHPGQSVKGPSAKRIRSPSSAMTTSTSSHVSFGGGSLAIPALRNVGAGSATRTPSH